ncbi:hypothetical protein [Nocardia terpenica]|uniref:Uncharacterized protein n=1 Tax=Nocardia terpenica TaxID=455432 RepID=A0A6G9ZDK7_9NOCA|nr:hypothetical protein [Nocardia terpenica]QIS23481.1 hypothetical protein F6W96_39455 [Nocardia terpenica]
MVGTGSRTEAWDSTSEQVTIPPKVIGTVRNGEEVILQAASAAFNTTGVQITEANKVFEPTRLSCRFLP